MKKPVLAVKDRALDSYNLPFTTTTTAQAVRSFSDEVNSDKNQSQVAKHPDDYDLYQIGEYDEETGTLKANEHGPQLVVRAKDLIRTGE